MDGAGGAVAGPAGVRVELRGVCASVYRVRGRDGGAGAADGGAAGGLARRAAESAGRGRQKRARKVHSHAAHILKGTNNH